MAFVIVDQNGNPQVVFVGQQANSQPVPEGMLGTVVDDGLAPGGNVSKLAFAVSGTTVTVKPNAG
jgi:hypothetical protein